ncbi:MAG: hypothetical protein ABW026_13705 [Microvirga sp.]
MEATYRFALARHIVAAFCDGHGERVREQGSGMSGEFEAASFL